jgi:hypothetical protein
MWEKGTMFSRPRGGDPEKKSTAHVSRPIKSVSALFLWGVEEILEKHLWYPLGKQNLPYGVDTHVKHNFC